MGNSVNAVARTSVDDRAKKAVSGGLLSDAVRRVAGEGAAAWNVHFKALQKAAAGEDVIFLSVGDPDFDTPPAITQAAIDALHAGRTHYTDFSGKLELRQAIADRRRVDTGQTVGPENIVVLSGGQAALFSTMFCLAQAGDEVIVPEPMYATYQAVVQASGASMVPVALDRKKNFHLDLDRVASAVTDRTRVILVNFPHNPTGAMLTPDESRGLAEICQQNDLWLVSDEVYSGLTYSRDFISPVAEPGMAERGFVISSLSKSHAMPGWRIGWVIAPGAMPGHIMNMVQCMLFGTPPFVMDAAEVALSQDFSEVEYMLAQYRKRRDFLVQRVAKIPRVECIAPEGGMFVMLDIRPSGLRAEDFAERLVEAEAVSMLPGSGFGAAGAGHVRLSLTASLERLSEAMDRLERFVTTLNQ